jgi:plastocyanin
MSAGNPTHSFYDNNINKGLNKSTIQSHLFQTLKISFMSVKKIMLSLIAAAFLSLCILSCSKSSSDGSGTTTPPDGGGNTSLAITINITGMSFPASTSVKKGTKVSWYNMDAMAHTVTSDDNTTFSSGNLASGATFSYVAAKIGSFPYHCNYHSNMVGTLVVTE